MMIWRGELLPSSRSDFVLGTDLQWVPVLWSSWHMSCVGRHRQGPREALPRTAKRLPIRHARQSSDARSWSCLLRYAGWVPCYVFWADFCGNGPPLVGGGCWDWRQKSPGKRDGRGVLRNTPAAVVGRGCIAGPAVKCQKQCKLGAGGRAGCLRESRAKAIFFWGCLLFQFVCCGVHIQGGSRGILHLLAQHGWMHGAVACCPAEGEEVWVYPLGWKALSQSCEEFPLDRPRGGEAVWEPWAGARVPEERLSWLRGLVRQARCAALLQTALLAGGSSRGTKYARQMWESRERADLIIARVGRVLVLGHVSLAGALPWPRPRGSLLLCASAEGQMVRLTPQGSPPRAGGSWCKRSHGWGQEFTLPILPLSSRALLPKPRRCQRLSPLQGKPSAFPLEKTRRAVVSGMGPLILSAFFWEICCCLSMGDRAGAWPHTRAGPVKRMKGGKGSLPADRFPGRTCLLPSVPAFVAFWSRGWDDDIN